MLTNLLKTDIWKRPHLYCLLAQTDGDIDKIWKLRYREESAANNLRRMAYKHKRLMMEAKNDA